MAYGTPFDQESQTTWELTVKDSTTDVVFGFTTKTNPDQWATKGDVAIKAAFQKVVTALAGSPDLEVLGAYQHHPRSTQVTP